MTVDYAVTEKEAKLVLRDVASRRGERTQIVGALSDIEWHEFHTILDDSLATGDIWKAGRKFASDISALKLTERERTQACNIVASALLPVLQSARVQTWRMATKTIAE